MPTARLFAQSVSRRTVLLIVCAIAVAALASLVTTRTGSACPGPPPRPLRTLYLESDRIVVAHIGETTPLDISFDDDNSYRKCSMRTALHVTSTIKGEGDQYTIYVYHERWFWNANQERGEEEQHEYSEYLPDDTLLIFLQNRKEGEGYEVSDTTYAIKKLPDADLKVYIERINELASIMQQEQPDNAQLVEWLVRCAEEPATRWEGAYELASSNSALYSQIESPASNDAAQEAEATEATEATNATDEQADIAVRERGSQLVSIEAGDANDNAAPVAVEAVSQQQTFELPVLVENPIVARRFSLDSPDFVQLLTDDQKQRLAAVVFNAKTITYNESLLLDLIKHWDEPRFVPFVISYLHSVVDEPPYMAEEMVTLIAEKLNDKALTALAEQYRENSSYTDDTQESSNEANEAEAQEAGEEEEQSDRFEKGLTGTNTQKRSARLRRFLASAESLMPK